MKKKILLLADDLRMHSGVATQSKEFVMGTLDKYDWVQVGGAVKHPEEGQIMDMSEAAKQQSGVKDAYLKVYPVSGYGNPNILREVLEIENPDAILHFTDPRFWIWLYNMEHEIRQHIPIMYYNIWDDLPDPHWNTNFYRSCDTLLGISKQTYGINKRLLKPHNYEDWQIKYIPHGISNKRVFSVEKEDTLYKRFNEKFGFDKYKFKILFLNRNIRRKQPADCVLAYKHFMDNLTPEQQKECVFIWHSAPSDENGTDIRAVVQNLLPEYPVIFTYDINGDRPFTDEEMNFLYNTTDVYVNIASNEGFGLGSLEALMADTNLVLSVTGGLQDQCGFKNDKGEYLTADDYIELGSNHRGKYKEHGKWVKPVFPSNISCQGSPMTPYIFDDRVQYEDVGDALRYWYDMDKETRIKYAKLGKEFAMNEGKMTGKHLADSFVEAIDSTFENWKPKSKYTMEVI